METAMSEAEWKAERDRQVKEMFDHDRKKERTRNLCVLSGACLTAMATAGLWSFAVDEAAVEMAEGILDRIERGPETEAREEAQS